MTTLGLMADPGLPERVARSIADGLAARLSAEHSSPGESDTQEWHVQVRQETLPITEEGSVPLMRHAQQIQEHEDWDYVVYLTDLPLWHEDDPLLGKVSASAKAALVSLPAIGAYRLRSHTSALVLELVDAMRRDASFATDEKIFGRRVRCSSPTPDDEWYLALPGHWSRWRLLIGMVRSNRPGRLLPALSNSVAAAIATGAFGIFYASVWNMADALPPLRLGFISVLAIAVLSSWLIIRNGLWNNTRRMTEPYRARRDNASTAITIALSVALMYVLLHAVLFGAGLIVIDSGFLESQLEHPVNLVDYVKLSWLAASLGTMAGALGSNFDRDEAIREATYSRREHERRQLADADADS